MEAERALPPKYLLGARCFVFISVGIIMPILQTWELRPWLVKPLAQHE